MARFSISPSVLGFLCAVLAGALQAGAPEAGVFTPRHTARLRPVTIARISPDGGRVAYVLAVPRDPLEDPSGPAWEELHVVLPGGVSRPFVAGEVNVGSISWTHDGSGIAFLAKRGKDKFTSLHVIPSDGGEARCALSFSTDIGGFSLSPDGERAAFIAVEPLPEGEEKLKEKGFRQEVYEESYRLPKVRIAKLWGGGEKPRTLELPGAPSDISWSPAGNRIALALAPTPLVDDSYMNRKVHVVDAESGKVIARFENPGKLGQISWSPDGRRLVVISAEDRHDPSAGRLLVASAEGGALRDLLPGFEGEVASAAWKDPETITYLASVGLWSELGEVRADGSGRKVRIMAGRTVLGDITASKDGETIAVIGESALHPGEVFLLRPGEASPRRTTVSNPWLEGLRLAAQETIEFKARDGLRLEGVLIRPLGEEKGSRHPLILYVHGGPEAHERNGWLTSYGKPGQAAAARGFAVFYPNYRGSTGRGVAFSKLGQDDPAGREFDDLVDAADHLIAAGIADPKKVGITGGSYGGYASAWAATRLSSRFAASVMFVGISDLISKTATSDIPAEDFLVHIGKRPRDDPMWFLERSPIHYAEEARTPILILHGKDDPRVSPTQSLELYRHLKSVGKAPVRLVWYPGEGHGNRASAARLDFNLRMLEWFEHYLKGPGGAPPDPMIDPAKE
jgi:dipeptidyl aminopeptidase/acylaminoacyl peptidase